jgi:hypothetical protein
VAKGILFVATNPVEPSREDEFNDWYSNVHVPAILELPGFVGARRYRVISDGETAHRYMAVYEIERDDVAAAMDELQKATAEGRGGMSDVLQLDPLPQLMLGELIE